MRYLIFLLLLFIFNFTFSQSVPQQINYQAILRDAAGVEIAAGASAVINVRIYNSLLDATSNPAYEENHNVVIPITKVINLKIGNGTQVSSTGFNSINWSTGEVNYLISVNTTPIGTRQVFSSVPYAFYSPGSSGNTYSSSANISITGNVLDLTSTSVAAGSYGGNSTAISKVPVFTVDNKGRLSQAGDFNANTGGDISGKLDSQTVVKLRNYPLLNINPVPGQVLQYGASGWGPATLTVSSSSTYTGSNGISVLGIAPNYSIVPVTNATVGVWSTVGNSNTNGSNGFIGTTDSNPFIIRTGNTIRAFFNGLNGNLGLGTINPAYRLHSVTTTGAVSIFGDNSSTANNPQAHGIIGSSASTSTLSAGIFGQSLGNGSGVAGTTSSTAQSAILGENFAVTSSSLAYGVQGISNNNNSLAAGVYGQNKASGFGVLGTTASNTAAIAGINTSSLNNPTGIGVYGLTSSSHTAAIAIYGENKGTGIGVFGRNTNPTANSAIGVYGIVTNTSSPGSAGLRGDAEGLSTAVQGYNFGNGIAIDAWQIGNGTGLNSNAGRFRITGIGNNAAALLATTNGTGAAVHGISSGTNRLAGLFHGKIITDSIAIVGPGTPTPGNVLTARDAAGNAKWSGPVVFKGIFSPTAGYAITNTGSLTVGGNTGYSGSVTYNTTGFPNGTLFSAGSMKFKAPQTGYYHIESNVAVVFSTSAGPIITIELVNLTTNTSIQTNRLPNPNSGVAVNANAFVSSIVFLNANDEVIVRLYGNVTATGNVVSGNSNYISGNLIR